VIEAVAFLGFESVSDAIPWRQAFPQYTDQELPGVCLAGARARQSVTQKQLSEMTGMAAAHFRDGKRQAAHRQKGSPDFGQSPRCQLQGFFVKGRDHVCQINDDLLETRFVLAREITRTS
jgi:hypothetical protein